MAEDFCLQPDVEEEENFILFLKSIANLEEEIEEIDTSNQDHYEQTIKELEEKLRKAQDVMSEQSKATAANAEALNNLLKKLKSKDEDIQELKERSNKEMSDLHNKLQQLQAELNRKQLSLKSSEDQLIDIEQDHRQGIEKLAGALKDKDKTIEALVESWQEKDKLIKRLQQVTAASRGTIMDNNRLRDEADELRNQLAKKKDEISELKLQLDRDGSRSPKAGFHVALEELKLQLAVKTEALKAAKQTEEDFREQINSLRKQLESAHQSMKEVHTTEKQVYYMRDNSDGNGHSDQYQDFIQRELNELQRIQEAEKQILLDLKEKSMFEKSHNIEAELAAIQTLKRELEAGIQRNNKLQQQLEQQKSRSPRKGSKDSSQDDHFDMERRFSDQSSDTANTSDSRRSSDTTPRNQDIEVPQHSYSWPLVQNKKPQLLKTWSPSSTDSDIPLNRQSLSEKSAPMLRKFIRQMKNQFDKAGKENDELRRKVDGFDSREIPGRNDSDVSSLPIMHLEIERLTQELSVKNEEIRKLKSSIGFAVDSMDLNDVPNLTDLQNENLKLKVQLGNLEELNMLLKKQIALNSQSASPDILKSLLMEARSRLQALEGKLEATEGTVRLARGRLQALKGTLEATEGTVRLQTKKMKYYRNLLEENGLVFKSPLGIRSNSESNIVMALGGRNLCKNSQTLSYDNIPELLVDSQTESSESDFSEKYKSYGNTNNVSELKDQVRQLKIAMFKYKAVIKSNMSQAKAQKLEETGGFVAKHTCLKERIRKCERKCHEIECYYNEATARIKKSADVIVNRMLIEIESGGNVRFEEGSPTDIWFSSCPDLVLSRFCASDYKDHNVSGIKIHRIIRIHNRMLRTWFDDILSSIVDDPDGEYYPCNRNTGYRKLLEYLFWMQDPQLSNGANEQGHLLEEGFLEAQTYSDLGRDGAVSLSNSLSLADRHRIEHLTKNGKNSDYSDSCPFRYAFSLDNFLLAENQAKVDPLPSATTTKLLQDTGISDYLQVTACDHAVLPFTTATGRLNDECGKLENSITLPADVSVNIQSDCTSVTMCSDIGYIDKKIQSTVKLDPCTYEITLGIETMETTVSLLQFQWGKPQSFALQGGLRMDYVIHDLTSEGMYLVSVDMGLCMETSDRDSCDVKHTVLDNVKLAKKSCNWNNGFAFSGNPSFDLSTWLSTNSYTNSIPLSELVVIELERYLQFEDYLQPSHCVASAPPFTPVNSEGWAFSSGCQNASTLTTLPGSGIVCNLGDSCTKIDCCVDIAKLDTTFRVYADLDVCSKEFTVGVENFNRTISLYSFQYAQEDTFSFGGLVNIKYKVVNYQSERVFVVNMDIEVCYSAAGPCAVQHTVLTDVKLPKSSCNYSQPYAIPDFSLVSYMSELDVNTNVNQLPSWAVDLLMEELGISGFQKDPQCDLSSYSGALSNGWNSTACGELITLPQLPAYTRCRLPSYCTGAQCCSNIGYLGRKLEAFVLVDPCSYSVSIGLEKRNINVTLLEFTQGSWQTVTLGNLLRLQYKAEELTAEKVYLLYMTISICFETVGDCRYTYTVFDGVKIPKQPCDWTGGYAIPGFNLNSYLTGLGYSTSTPLNSLVSSQLLEYLGVASLLKTTADQCQMSDPMYTSPTNGWTKDAGCTSAVDLPTLGSNSVCHLYDTCTGISCCLHSTTVDRNFNVFLKLDPCTQKLDIGIEKYQFDFSLYTFTFETTQYFHIDRVIEIEYKITDLVGEMVYLVDMKVKICFNDPSPCDLQDTIVVNTKLPKMVCPWFRGYPDPSWSLNQWYLDNSLTPGSNLDSSAVSSLMESSQIGEYLLSPMVSRVDPFGTYAAAYLGWSSECTEAPVTLLQMDQSVISCNLESTCRGLSCALDVPFISKTFEFYMRLEQCDYMLKVGIERQQYERTLKGYQWGEWTHVDLNGILKMSFVLHDLYAEPAFLISMKLSLCWEANQPCGTVYNIFDKVRLPKKVCDWDKKFLQNDFSLTQYKTDNSISTLDDHHVSDILRLTGISQYMKRTPCSRTAAPYTGADANNWKNDCVDPVGSLLNLGSDTTCHLDSSCTAVDCCVDSTSLGLTLNGYVRLDPCNYKIYIGLEGIDLDYTLIDFSFGTVQHYAMNEVFNLDFVVDDLTADKVYVVSMNISVCLESGGACEVVTSVFQDHRLPKAECDYDSQFVIPGFSLNEYLDDKSVPTNSVPLDIHTIAQLLHDTALAPYMMDNACDQTVIPYYPNDKGWNRGQLVISKVYLGKSVKALDDRQISKSSYPKIDAVFKPRKMCISIEGDTLCECSARQCEWYLFDNRLVLPEYVVEFEYVTKIERLRALLQDPEVTKINFASFDDLPLPLDPNIKVNGICVEKATLLKWRGLEAERYQTALDQRANALNSRKKLENDIKDLRQQAELAVFVKEDAVIQFKHVQVQMNDNQTELDEMQASMKDIERKLENYKADVLKLQEDLPASDRRNPEAERDELYIFTLFTSLSFGGVILMLKFKTMQNL